MTIYKLYGETRNNDSERMILVRAENEKEAIKKVRKLARGKIGYIFENSVEPTAAADDFGEIWVEPPFRAGRGGRTLG